MSPIICLLIFDPRLQQLNKLTDAQIDSKQKIMGNKSFKARVCIQSSLDLHFLKSNNNNNNAAFSRVPGSPLKASANPRGSAECLKPAGPTQTLGSDKQIISDLKMMNKVVNETPALLKHSAGVFEVLGGIRRELSTLSQALLAVQGGGEETSCYDQKGP